MDLGDDDGWQAYDGVCCVWFPVPRLSWRPLTQRSRAPYAGSISICTCKSRALFAVNDKRRRLKLAYAQTLAAGHDIVATLETHDDGHRGRHLELCLRETHICYWNSLDDTGTAGGTALLHKKT